MLQFEMREPWRSGQLGFIPNFLTELSDLTAREQLDINYSHGGGWIPIHGWRLHEDNSIEYPGDEPLQPIACGMLRDETICIYPYAWVAIIQPDRTFEVARMD